MSPSSYIIFALFIIVGVVCFVLQLQTFAVISAALGIVVLLLEKAPKSKIKIAIERVNTNTHKVIIENTGNYQMKDIRYVYHGKLSMPENYLPTELEPQQRVELPIGLSFETGPELDVEVSWTPNFGLSRQKKRIKTQAIG